MTNWVRRLNYRFWSNDEIRKIAAQLDNYRAVVNVSGWLDRDKEGRFYREYFSAATEYKVSNHPGDAVKGVNSPNDLVIDLQQELSPDLVGRFDLVLNHTVLEHVRDPVFAFKQLASLSGDLLLTVVPWKQEFHFIPGQFGDYYRFSPMIMRELFTQNGFTLLYEGYTPEPAMEIYLVHLGSKHPELHVGFDKQIPPLESLNGVVGHAGYVSVLLNVVLRLLYRAYLFSKGSR